MTLLKKGFFATTIILCLTVYWLRIDVHKFDERQNFVNIMDKKRKSSSKSEKVMFELENPYVPYEAFALQKDAKDCREFPSTRNLLFDNSFWQLATLNSSTLYIYSAHYDERALQKGRKVHLLGETDRLINNTAIKCHLWFGTESPPVVTEEVEVDYLYDRPSATSPSQEILQPFILSCRIPNDSSSQVPMSVSVSDLNCKTLSNNVRVHYNATKRKNGTAVCMRGLHYNKDNGLQFIEWLEINRVFGAEKFSVYFFTLHERTVKALEPYVEAGLVELLPVTIAGPQPNTYMMRKQEFDGPAWGREVLAINDCYLRNMNLYKYVTVQDMDEIIVPKKHNTWDEMIQSVNGSYTSFSYSDVYFWDNVTVCREGIPCSLHYLQRIVRSPKYRPNHYKSIHDTDRVFFVNNHRCLRCFGGCSTLIVPTDLAHLQHYRAICSLPLKNQCESEYRNGSYEEKILWKYKDAVISSVSRVLALVEK